MLQIPFVGVARHRASRTKNFLSLLYIGIGSLFELYDFVLFAVLVPVIAPLFFPSDTTQGSVVLGYLAFGIAFVMALFGSLIWGRIGDRRGSGVIFRASVLLMAIPSIGIAMLPTYESIGVLAPIVLILLRLMQGFSISGEALGAKIYAFERFGEKRYLAASAFISAFGGMGVLLAMYAGGYIVSHPEESELWRKAFMLGGSVMFLIGAFRMISVKSVSAGVKNVGSLKDVIRESKAASVEAFLASIMLGVFSYFMHGFLINYLMLFGADISEAISFAQLGLVGTVFAAMLLFVFAVLGRVKVLELRSLALYISIPSFPLILLLQSDVYLIKCSAVLMLGAMLGIYASIAAIRVVMSFKDGQRCRGALFVNALGVSVFGGFTPFVMSVLAGINLALPAVLFSSCFALCYIILRSR